ncbi:pyrimidine reductase, riboflavin biosynthesis [Neocallimastix lanati (nom. inval.)]|jgi:riboflavin biosynthesis pyrimidine reductase|uniref:2,5-diamino-6-ribosylamino-4(3H)-pyrimidinone 5'-phosphate reductase n=1 Tax=Neocallimastix californiae TaxID=1754190 RepID=A0A1Y2FKQ1_9FUNG|nr:pyrimidine reductase, riboflavin biosynthesis [Neocallimastix sp. JGI-2020a]ORY84561.1 pyrimidine reductase, riboflavin biosynthesis [Neocallimastix californiae]|eukprot:ORY84561.1 pyrimidine reductase, riboflavin biosynthesis [Neocallimastix californiae]
MTKPFIVCYMMTTIDGRIECAMLEKLKGGDAYESIITDELRTPSTLVGRVTAELEMATGKFKPTATPEPLGKQGFSKKVDAVHGYDIIVDTKGTLLWDKENEKPYLIITGEQVSKEYLAYLDSKNISWIACGEKTINLAKAVEILANEFKIDRLAVVGGTAINTAFLEAGLLDEISILIGPGIDGRKGFSPLFDGRATDKDPIQLKLKDVKKYDDGAVLISYTV